MRWCAWIAGGVVCTVLGCSAASNEGGSGGESGNAGAGGGSGASGGGTSGSGGLLNTGAGSGSGGGGFGGQSCAGVTQTASGTLPVDVIWAIDTSCSMTEETAAVRDNMNKFSQLISNAGVDVRIVLIAEQWAPSPFPFVPEEGICIDKPLGSGQCPNDTNFPLYAHVYETVGSTDALLKYLQMYPAYKNMLRPEAVKIFTVVTDDNSSLPAADFTTQVNALDPTMIKPSQWKMYGIYCFSKCPSAAKPGAVYAELVQQTGGVASDMCLQKFDPVFNQLALGVVGAAKLDCAWGIPPPPPGEKFDPGKVNVIFTPGGGTGAPIGKVGSAADCGPQGGWYYDNDQAPTKVEVCDTTCQSIQSDLNGKIEVQFGCATIHVPK